MSEVLNLNDVMVLINRFKNGRSVENLAKEYGCTDWEIQMILRAYLVGYDHGKRG